MKGQLKIEKMYAYIALDEDGTEGVVGFQSPTGWMPMVGADMEMMENLRPIAKTLAASSGSEVTLAMFRVRDDLEVIAP